MLGEGNLQMPWWCVSFSVILVGGEAGDEEEVEIYAQAPSSRDALLCATARLRMRKGEMLHMTHVGAPHKTPNEDTIGLIARERVFE